ncbi:hypothetical protein J7E45_13590 [Microbacterium sp. ISL-59]|uniref:hypothetical protein n=1 Tax=Microbacterium sp. ISL-59 TaxID=2819159 RepID=UPI001BEB8B64|nr:hypothetical protein [Microbacterium sp. ISL-59]MBT2496642.1 hypothetical protein [Microbacterium sp. ISL-59]
MRTREGRPSLVDGIALGLIATGAVSVGIGAIVAVTSAASEIFGTAPTVSMPVHDVDLTALDGVSGVSAATVDTALVTVPAMPSGARWMLLLETLLPALATVALCAGVWWLGVSLIRSRPFRASLGWMFAVASILMIAGSLFGQFAGGVGRAMIVQDLATTDPQVEDVLWTLLVQFDLAPVGWAFALALVAGLFEIGRRLQRETEGLV